MDFFGFELQWPSATEWIAVFFSLSYVVLAAKNSAWCWILGFISSLLWAYQVWFEYDLLFDGLLNVFYAVMAIVGYLQWKPKKQQEDLPISRMTNSQHTVIILSGILITVVFGYVVRLQTGAEWVYLDALTTTFSVFATFMLVNRKIENWIYLAVMDLLYVYLYLVKGSVIFSALFLLYTILAILGYLEWIRQERVQNQGTTFER